MKLSELYKKAIETGIKNDPRGVEFIKQELDARKKDFESLKGREKELFDLESLKNPYSDSRILAGTGDEVVKTALVGIDIEVSEVLLADALNTKGRKIDLLIAHHPSGRAYANLHMVMQMQADILGRFGVPINVAEDLMEGRMREVQRRIMPVNHTRPVDAARLIGLPFVCLHTPADNMVATYLQRLCDDKKPYRISDLLDLLFEIPEYKEGAMNSAGPEILLGSKSRKVGKVFVDMTGGTEGSKEIFQSMAQSGINTILAMHLGEDHRKEAEKYHMNVVIAGHIASDNVGINLLLDEVCKTSALEIQTCSGYRRVSRIKTS